MDELPDYIPLRKQSKVIAWLSAMLGLTLVNLAAHWFTGNGRRYPALAALIGGLALVAFALWRVSNRRRS